MYWEDRMANAQDKLATKNLKEINKQLIKYYRSSAKKVIKGFEDVYNKILLQEAEGKQITPALLYKLDTYWELQSQLSDEARRLGDKQIELLSENFEKHFFDIYNSIALPSGATFNQLNKEAVREIINQVWVADGKNFSQRIWGNTEKLIETLNEELIHCVAAGKKTDDLKKILQHRFNVSYHNADSVARTELAHIQTQAAKQRYVDAGITKIKVWASPDERRCDVCGKLHEKEFPANGTMPIPAHTNCRCCVIPVVE